MSFKKLACIYLIFRDVDELEWFSVNYPTPIGDRLFIQDLICNPTKFPIYFRYPASEFLIYRAGWNTNVTINPESYSNPIFAYDLPSHPELFI